MVRSLAYFDKSRFQIDASDMALSANQNRDWMVLAN